MGRSGQGRGTDGARAVVRLPLPLPLPLLTSRRHIDLLRVCSAASPLHRGGPVPARS
ncbi:hypothetical protein ABTX80_24260 [Streptomyces erythrochromogenes]|uniref:hypothetical protein n=1 Tax=Streptomyces erythrochromogenes TaxID=285574 RepID=UPI0033181C3E